MDKRQESRIRKLGVFTLPQAEEIGLSQQSISRLVAADDLKRVARGLYLHPDAELNEDVGPQIAFAKFRPEAAIGGLSALYHYNLAVFLPKANAKVLSQALKRCFAYRSTALPQSFSAVLSAIDRKSLERGWMSATSSIPDRPHFQTTFETIVKMIGDLEESFPNRSLILDS